MKTTTVTTSTTTTTMAKTKTTTKARPKEFKLTTKATSNGSLSTNGSGHVSLNGSTTGSTASRKKKSENTINESGDDVSLVSGSSSNEVVVVKSQSPPWKKTFDYIADQAFNVAGAAYLSLMAFMVGYFIRTQTDISFWDEFQSGARLMMFHYHGLPFFGALSFLITLRWLINKIAYPIVLKHIYEGKNHKYTAHYCEWLFDAIKNTILFSMGAYVASGSDWWPIPTAGSFGWYPRQGGTIFDSDGEIVPTCALALEVIGHFEVTVDFVALLTLCYDATTEYYEARAQRLRHGDETKQATTTTSFAEDFVHHSGVVMGALFLYITAKDNANAIVVVVLLGQFNDMCEFAALVLGLCKNWFLERVVTPILCVFWTISLFYIWPAAIIPIFTEAIPIEHNFDQKLVLQLTIYQVGILSIAALFWAMHMFWLYKGLLFLYRYQRGVYFQEKKLKFKKDKAPVVSMVPQYGRTACLASGTVLKPTKEE